MRRAILITVRSDSSRLPNKTFRELSGRPVLEHIIKRAKMAKKFDGIVVCTTDRVVDNPVEELAEKCDVNCFRGSLYDKLDRWRKTTEKFNIDFFVTFDGDDLFCDPELLDLASDVMDSKDVDFIESPEGLVCGAFTYAIRTTALNKVCEMKASNDTEMMWVYFKDTGLFKTSVLPVNKSSLLFDTITRLTLDYPEDFDFFSKVFLNLNIVDNELSLKKIMDYLKKNPDIVQINAFLQDEFIKNQRKKTKLKLKNGYQIWKK